MPDVDGTGDDAATVLPGQDEVAPEATADESTADEPSTDEPLAVEEAAGAPDAGDPDSASSDSEGATDVVVDYELDEVLAGSEAAARAALAEITPAETIGALVATVAQGEHVVSLQFANLMRGYPGWLWTATLSRIDETEDVNVLEVELLPGDGAVLAPDWVPWSVRLADYRAAQDAAGEEFDEADSDDEDDFEDSEDDESDDDTSDDSDEDDSDEDDSDDDDDEDSDDDDSDDDDSDDDDSDDDDSDEDSDDDEDDSGDDSDDDR